MSMPSVPRFPGLLLAAAVLAAALSACADRPEGGADPAPRSIRLFRAPLADGPADGPAAGEAGVERFERPGPDAEYFEAADGPSFDPRRGADRPEGNGPGGPGGDAVTLTFDGTDIREVARVVLGDLLGLPLAIDPAVQGVVTFQTSGPVARADLLPMLESLLGMTGHALVFSEGTYAVLPASEAVRWGGGVLGEGEPWPAAGGTAMRVVPLRYASAGSMGELLRSVAGTQGTVREVPGREMLVLAGTRRDLAAMTEMVETFDVDWLSGMSYALFHPRNARAKPLLRELETVFAGTRGAGEVRLAGIDRLNAILAMSRRPERLREVGRWVERLDREAEAEERRVYVYDVQNGRAADLAANLTALFGTGEGAGGGRAPGAAGDATAGFAAGFSAGAAEPAPGSGSGSGSGSWLGSGFGPDMSEAEPEVPAAGAGVEAVEPMPGLRVVADEKNNALLVLGTARDWRLVESTLARLDVAPLQVMIEAVVAEVTLTSDLRYGLQWLFRSGNVGATLSEMQAGVVSPRFPGFSASYLAGTDIRVVLNALESVTAVDVISSPQLLVVNNGTARLQVGDQVPVATQQARSILAPDAPVVNTIQFRDTGVILEVTPRVNQSGLVLLDIAQEVSDVARTTSSELDSPTIQQRRIASTVSLRDGETVALGGLIRDRRGGENSGLPVLKDLPGLGVLFGAEADENRRTELIVLITPRVVRSQVDLRRVTDELRGQMRSLRFEPVPGE